MVLTEWEAVSSLDWRDASESWSPLPQRPSFHHMQLVNATRCANMLFGHDLKSGPWKLSQHVVCANTSSGASSTPRPASGRGSATARPALCIRCT